MHGRDHPRRRVQHDRDTPPRRAPQLLPGVAENRGKQLPRSPPSHRGQAPTPSAGTTRLCRSRQHLARRWLSRDGAHARPGPAPGPG
jgi:hypothetical protein